jgi:ERCC4-type nuclease
MTLYIDCREHALLARMKAESKQMSIGDISIEKEDQTIVLIERKTVADLAASICDGRYQEQQYRLLESTLPPHRIVYLIEGSMDTPTSLPKKNLESALLSLWFHGFSVFHTSGIDGTVEYLTMLVEKVNKDATEKDYISMVKIKKKDKLTPENIDGLMMSQIPGISTVTAKALLDVYGTMYALTTQLKETPTLLDTFTTGEKKRKLSKKVIESLKIYLHIV